MKKTGGLKRLVSINNYIPEEIVKDILLRLDVKSLRRFECVCKSWKTLIRQPSFINNHYKRQPRSLILLQSPPIGSREEYKFGKIHGRSDGFNKFKRCEIFPSSFLLEGCDKGLACLSDRRDNVCLWNPTTNESKSLPSPPTSRRWKNPTYQHGIGYDSLTDDFKVVRVCTWDGVRPVNFFRSDNEVFVYSLGRNSWKRIVPAVFSSLTSAEISSHECYILQRQCPVVVSGSIHWISFLSWDGCWIVAFDLSTEVFKLIDLPRMGKFGVMGKLSDCLSLDVEELDRHNNPTYVIWVMKEYGVLDSWVK
ncbi:hypothetical protein TIFTF001_022870 [Ficus carica]|uniref:F-box domain-containing protein n=1 Tax=Ficus carica TaxID=3494 RepID=A0AA88AMM3_FICCA|nr:hypothetical protein TIFTF001_022870 [Ficus carica]